jgi:pantoate--beta-alanine ligase
MQVVTTIAELWAARRQLQRRLALVPTMGALHAGHLALVQRAHTEADVVWASLFVNPLQFGQQSDLDRYPRPREADLTALRESGVTLVFAPDTQAMYQAGFSTRVTVAGVSEGLEGAARPGHFDGVTTVVAKLFVLTRPDVAVFGEKDAQQLRVIRRLVVDLGFDLRIVGVPTVREPDGLALSSRNVHLSPAERSAATSLSRALFAAQAAYQAGERDAERLRTIMRATLAAEPLARIDYVSLADDATLCELDQMAGPALASLAVWIGATRLIDNVRLSPETSVPPRISAPS